MPSASACSGPSNPSCPRNTLTVGEICHGISWRRRGICPANSGAAFEEGPSNVVATVPASATGMSLLKCAPPPSPSGRTPARRSKRSAKGWPSGPATAGEPPRQAGVSCVGRRGRLVPPSWRHAPATARRAQRPCRWSDPPRSGQAVRAVNPFAYIAAPGCRRMSYLFDTLLWADSTGEQLPRLASRHERSEDGLVHTSLQPA